MDVKNRVELDIDSLQISKKLKKEEINDLL